MLLILECYSKDVFPHTNVASGTYRFRGISDPNECQRKCQANSECEGFVFVLSFEGCLLKIKKNGSSDMSTQKAIVVPKYCPTVSVCAKDEFDCR